MPNRQIYWLSQIGGWFIYWLLVTLINLLVNGKGGNVEELWKEQIQLTIFITIGLVATHIFRNYVKKKKWVSLNVGVLVPRLLLSVFILTVAILATFLAIIYIGNLENSDELTNGVRIFQVSINVSIIIGLWMSIYFSVQYFKNYRKAQMFQLKQDALLKEATLNKLRSQLNPHFIFNSLNSIRALVTMEPEKARDSITALSNIFRKSLQLDKSLKIPFNEELQIVKDYLKLEKIRFEERLDDTMEVSPEVYQSQVPPLMLQTLVENGIKHGISNLPEGGLLSFEAYPNGEYYVFKIRNSGQLVENNKRKGYGLKNTRERLDLMYDGRASIEITNTDDGFVTTILKLPKEEKK